MATVLFLYIFSPLECVSTPDKILVLDTRSSHMHILSIDLFVSVHWKRKTYLHGAGSFVLGKNDSHLYHTFYVII